MRNILDSILPQYQKVTEAQTYSTLFDSVNRDENAMRNLMKKEETVLYKAITNEGQRSESVFLVQNPALMTYQISLNRPIIRRMKPKLVATGAEISKLARKESQKNTSPDAWWDESGYVRLPNFVNFKRYAAFLGK